MTTRLLTLDEVATRCRTPKRRVGEWVSKGLIAVVRFSDDPKRGKKLVAENELERFLRTRTTGGTSEGNQAA